jgi:restriction endonuclease S subunit
LAANPVVRAQIRASVNAAGRDVANGAIINALQFPWPPLSEQQRIVDVLAEGTSRVRIEQSTARKLRLLRDGLRDDFLTGRVGQGAA